LRAGYVGAAALEEKEDIMKSGIYFGTISVIFMGFIALPAAHAQPPEVQWSITYGGINGDVAYSVQQTSQGGYIFAGYTRSFGADSNDVYLVKTDSLGDTLWSRIYGGADIDEARSIDTTMDGGYIIAGWTYSFGAGNSDMYLLKTDSQGDTLWTRTYGGMTFDRGYSVQQTNDSGYVVVGNLGRYIYLVKTDNQGDTVWTNTYGIVSANENKAYSVQQTSDGGYIFAGATNLFETFWDVYLVKTDSMGDTLWTRTYGGADLDRAWSVQQSSDGGYIVAGEDPGGVYLLKTDILGHILWDRSYGGTCAYAIQETTDRGYIVAGYTWEFNPAGRFDIYLIKTDSQGDTLWTLVYRRADDELATSVRQTTDGGYIVAGHITDWYSPIDCLLLKTGPDTAVSGAPTIQWVSHPNNFILHAAYPNPFNPVTTIFYDVPVRGIVRVDVYNVLGQKTAELVNGIARAGRHSVSWDAGELPSGIYFVRMSARTPSGESGEFHQTRKVVLLK
jgi:hypothetical protein